MKKLKKTLKVVLIVFACLVTFLVGYKIWQRQIMDLKNPELESVKSIVDFKQLNNVSGELTLIAKDTAAFYKVINPYFDNGGIWVFDSRGKTIDANIENLGGSCFEDIKDDIVKSDFYFKNTTLNQNFFNEKHNFLDELVVSTVSIGAEGIKDMSEYSFDDYEYIVVYGWSKYYGMSHSNSQIKEIEAQINSSDKKVLLVGVNVDYVDYWYPKELSLPTVK